jgi:hypothetical protein
VEDFGQSPLTVELMHELKMDDIHSVAMNHDEHFSEDDLGALLEQLNQPISPLTATEPAPVDPTSLEADDNFWGLTDLALQSVEKPEQQPSSTSRTPAHELQTTEGARTTPSREQDMTEPLAVHYHDTNSVGLKAESGDPPLFTTGSDFDESFNLDDQPVEAIQSRLSPQQITSPCQMPQQHAIHFHQPPFVDPNAPFYYHPHAVVSDHQMIGEQVIGNGRRRSQSMPPEIDAGMFFQRKWDGGNAISIGQPISVTLDRQMGPPSSRYGRYHQQLHKWQDNKNYACGSKTSARPNNDVAVMGHIYGPQSTGSHLHPDSAPMTAPASPSGMVRPGTGGPRPRSLRKQNGASRDETDRRKTKKQKVMETEAVHSHYLDTMTLHFEQIEQFVREGIEDLKWKRAGEICGEEFERSVCVFFSFALLRGES